ncbi:hypothetical protein TeGR_g372 [Tetraparma gracilis]|uniref:Uncharacterized protein n=1 Tax=Tetraparma gracilis TaxID=2962635 RepID=A0ABQ6N2V7_9STRA|nr:hypothetical protein TeGR_g372 [Tetraparma gracilis]
MQWGGSGQKQQPRESIFDQLHNRAQLGRCVGNMLRESCHGVPEILIVEFMKEVKSGGAERLNRVKRVKIDAAQHPMSDAVRGWVQKKTGEALSSSRTRFSVKALTKLLGQKPGSVSIWPQGGQGGGVAVLGRSGKKLLAVCISCKTHGFSLCDLIVGCWGKEVHGITLAEAWSFNETMLKEKCLGAGQQLSLSVVAFSLGGASAVSGGNSDESGDSWENFTPFSFEGEGAARAEHFVLLMAHVLVERGHFMTVDKAMSAARTLATWWTHAEYNLVMKILLHGFDYDWSTTWEVTRTICDKCLLLFKVFNAFQLYYGEGVFIQAAGMFSLNNKTSGVFTDDSSEVSKIPRTEFQALLVKAAASKSALDASRASSAEAAPMLLDVAGEADAVPGADVASDASPGGSLVVPRPEATTAPGAASAPLAASGGMGGASSASPLAAAASASRVRAAEKKGSAKVFLPPCKLESPTRTQLEQYSWSVSESNSRPGTLKYKFAGYGIMMARAPTWLEVQAVRANGVEHVLLPVNVTREDLDTTFNGLPRESKKRPHESSTSTSTSTSPGGGGGGGYGGPPGGGGGYGGGLPPGGGYGGGGHDQPPPWRPDNRPAWQTGGGDEYGGGGGQYGRAPAPSSGQRYDGGGGGGYGGPPGGGGGGGYGGPPGGGGGYGGGPPPGGGYGDGGHDQAPPGRPDNRPARQTGGGDWYGRGGGQYGRAPAPSSGQRYDGAGYAVPAPNAPAPAPVPSPSPSSRGGGHDEQRSSQRSSQESSQQSLAVYDRYASFSRGGAYRRSGGSLRHDDREPSSSYRERDSHRSSRDDPSSHSRGRSGGGGDFGKRKR